MKRRLAMALILGAAARDGQRGSGDYLARLLHPGDLGLGMVLAGMAVAFGLGAVHALSPGHSDGTALS